MLEEPKDDSTSSKKFKSKKPVYLGTFFSFKKDVDDKFTKVQTESDKIERRLFWRSLITFVAIIIMFILMYIYH